MSEKFLISHGHLIKLAGKAAYNRGMNYFKAGNVLSIKQRVNTIKADVDGSEVYRVTLKWTQSQLDGACDCPASEGFDFCKHCVAVALTLQQSQQEQDKLVQGDAENRIKAYLLKQDRKKLADWLLELIESEDILLQEWSMRADSDLGLLDTKAIKKRITAAIPYRRNLYRYNQVRNYFSPVEMIADQLQDMAEQLPADDTLKLIDYALQRIDRALESIDDSGGFRLYAMEILGCTHIVACKRLSWPKKKIVKYLTDLTFGNYQDMYPDIPASYTDALGKDGMQLFYESLQDKWDALPALKQGASYEKKQPYQHLQYLLLQQPELSDDIHAKIHFEQKTATDLYDYQKLAELCLETGDLKAVEHWLKKCSHASELDYHQRTERLQIKLSIAKSSWGNALKQQWQLYEKSLQLKDYLRLLELAEKAGDKKDWQKKAIQWLKKQSEEKETVYPLHASTDRLLEIYLHHEQFEKALDLVKNKPAHTALLTRLAWCLSDQPENAFPIFQRIIEYHVNLGNNDAYHHAISLLQEMAEKMNTRKHKQQMMPLLEHLRKNFRAKRNFIKWLNEAFG